MDRQFLAHASDRQQRRKIFQPKTSSLAGIVPELPRLHNAIRLSPARGHDADWIFDCDFRHKRASESHKKLNRFQPVLLSIGKPFLVLRQVPLVRRASQKSARGVENRQIPTAINKPQNIAKQVLAAILCG